MLKERPLRCAPRSDSLQIDDVDRRIIACLSHDARRSFADIGSRVGLSAPAVKRRVDRLRAADVITGFVALVDPAALGWTTEAFVELFCRGRTSTAAIAASLRDHPEVVAAYSVTGEADALLHLRTSSTEHLELTLERIRASPTTDHTRSVIVLSRLIDGPHRQVQPS
jgi:DNA-binding Lrp family transcriptional regulator